VKTILNERELADHIATEIFSAGGESSDNVQQIAFMGGE